MMPWKCRIQFFVSRSSYFFTDAVLEKRGEGTSPSPPPAVRMPRAARRPTDRRAFRDELQLARSSAQLSDALVPTAPSAGPRGNPAARRTGQYL